MLWWSRLKAAMASVACRETWSLSARQRWAMTKILLATRPATAQTGTFLCAYWPPVGSRAFRRHLCGVRRISSGEHVPLVAHVSITDHCPYACQRCSNLSRGAHMETSTACRLLTELREAGTTTVAFTGGEPLTHEGLTEMIRCCSPEMSPILFTTGYGLTGSFCDALREAGLAAAFVSLDHHEPLEHNRIRRHSEAHEIALRAVRLFRDHGIYTGIQAVVDGALLKKGQMEQFVEFCRSLAVHEIMLLEPVQVAGREPGCVPLSESDRLLLKELHRQSSRDESWPKINSMSFLESGDFLGCQAGFCFLYVTAGGDVCPCDFVPCSFGNCRETSIREILDRMKMCFAQPACECLAPRMPNPAGCSVPGLTGWEEACRSRTKCPADIQPELARMMFNSSRGHYLRQ